MILKISDILTLITLYMALNSNIYKTAKEISKYYIVGTFKVVFICNGHLLDIGSIIGTYSLARTVNRNHHFITSFTTIIKQNFLFNEILLRTQLN